MVGNLSIGIGMGSRECLAKIGMLCRMRAVGPRRVMGTAAQLPSTTPDAKPLRPRVRLPFVSAARCSSTAKTAIRERNTCDGDPFPPRGWHEGNHPMAGIEIRFNGHGITSASQLRRELTASVEWRIEDG